MSNKNVRRALPDVLRPIIAASHGGISRTAPRMIPPAITGCDIHPLNNVAELSISRRMRLRCGAGSAMWRTGGFEAAERSIRRDGWSFRADPGRADVC